MHVWPDCLSDFIPKLEAPDSLAAAHRPLTRPPTTPGKTGGGTPQEREAHTQVEKPPNSYKIGGGTPQEQDTHTHTHSQVEYVRLRAIVSLAHSHPHSQNIAAATGRWLGLFGSGRGSNGRGAPVGFIWAELQLKRSHDNPSRD